MVSQSAFDAAGDNVLAGGQAAGAEAAIERLRAGNAAYLQADANDGDISAQTIAQLANEGQSPFACIVSCADSRVVPEHIFMSGLGELFCIRVAGNVIGPMELASCVYAAEHLHVPLIVVLGHTGCGAIESALEASEGDALAPGHALEPLVSSIIEAIGGETDPYAASVANVRASVNAIRSDASIVELESAGALNVVPAVYHTDSGSVEFL